MAGKNSQIHLFLETDVLQSLKIQARNLEIPLSKLCRKKLGECSQLDRIELRLGEIEKKLNTKINLTGGKNGKRTAEI